MQLIRLQASLDSALLSDDMKAKIRALILKAQKKREESKQREEQSCQNSAAEKADCDDDRSQAINSDGLRGAETGQNTA